MVSPLQLPFHNNVSCHILFFQITCTNHFNFCAFIILSLLLLLIFHLSLDSLILFTINHYLINHFFSFIGSQILINLFSNDFHLSSYLLETNRFLYRIWLMDYCTLYMWTQVSCTFVQVQICTYVIEIEMVWYSVWDIQVDLRQIWLTILIRAKIKMFCYKTSCTPFIVHSTSNWNSSYNCICCSMSYVMLKMAL